MGSFLPTTDNGLLSWAANAAPKLVATPLVWGITPLEAASFNAAYEAFSESLTLTSDPATRTTPAITLKNERRLALRLAASNISKKVQGTETVSDSQKQELRLNVRAVPQRRPIPNFSPDIDVKSVTGNTALIRLHGSDSARRAKPAMVSSAQVFTFVGSAPPTNGNDWVFQGACTRVDAVEVNFDPSLPMGTKGFICAAWTNERNQAGPACAPVVVTLLGSGSMPMVTAPTGGMTLAA